MQSIPEAKAREHWENMNRDRQIRAVCDMLDDGYSENTISHATGWSGETIRQLIEERQK